MYKIMNGSNIRVVEGQRRQGKAALRKTLKERKEILMKGKEKKGKEK